MEVASVLAQKNIQTTLIIREDRVWSRVFTPVMSAFFEQYYTARGVRIVKQARVAALEGKDGVQAVLLNDREKISCDLVVVGVGAVPVTELLEKTDIAIDDGIVVNQYLESSRAGIYAAGISQTIPIPFLGSGGGLSIGTMLFLKVSIGLGLSSANDNPLFTFHISVQMFLTSRMGLWGDTAGASEIVVRGDADSSSFSVWWLKDKQVVAAFVMNRPDETSGRTGMDQVEPDGFHRSVCQTKTTLY